MKKEMMDALEEFRTEKGILTSLQDQKKMENNAINKQIKYEVIDMADRVDRME